MVYSEFADLLSAHLRQADRTATWLADKLGVNRSTVNRWLNDETRPSNAQALQKIAVALSLNDAETTVLFQTAGYAAPALSNNKGLTTQAGGNLSFPHNFAALDAQWVGRASLVQHLSQELRGNRRLLLLVGMAGIGKTALGERLAVELMQQNSAMQLSQLNFDHRDGQPDFVGVMAPWLDQWDGPVPATERSSPQLLLERILRYLQTEKRLLIIDALENILVGESAANGSYIDHWWGTFFQQVLSAETLQGALIVTSQQIPVHLEQIGSQYPARWFVQPLIGLAETEQLALFEAAGINLSTNSKTKDLLLRIGAVYAGHPLVLRTIAGEIVQEYQGSLTAYWSTFGAEFERIEEDLQATQQTNSIYAANDKWQLENFSPALQRRVQYRLAQTFERLRERAYAAYVMLCGASIYRAPIKESWWLRHLEERDYTSQEQHTALQSLRDRYLVDESLDASGNRVIGMHNLIRSIALKHYQQHRHSLTNGK